MSLLFYGQRGFAYCQGFRKDLYFIIINSLNANFAARNEHEKWADTPWFPNLSFRWQTLQVTLILLMAIKQLVCNGLFCFLSGIHGHSLYAILSGQIDQMRMRMEFYFKFIAVALQLNWNISASGVLSRRYPAPLLNSHMPTYDNILNVW